MFSSLKQQQIYGSVILPRSRTSAILAQFFLIHVVQCTCQNKLIFSLIFKIYDQTCENFYAKLLNSTQ